MKRKIFFIVIGALLILALIFLLWFWFFGRGNKSDVLPNNGSLGTAQDATNNGSNNGNSGNGQAPYGTDIGTSNTGSTGSGSTGGSVGGSSVGTPTYTTIGSTSIAYYSTPSGVTWFSTGSGGVGGGGYNFNTTPITGVAGGAVTGTPYIPTVTGADGSQVSIFSSLLTVIGGCLIQYGIEHTVIAPATTAVDTGIGAAGNIIAGLFGFNVSGSTPFNPQYTSDITEQGKTSTDTVTQCLARTLGRIAVQQITQSTINWINSGFNGQPAYVQDYGQFFSNVADQAAGNFIQGSGLAFLCSPFQLQVKIAIAQAYANTRSGGASNSCTLSGVTGNIQNFLNGDFSDGGWPAFLQLTTVPANNPYAGYVQGQIALNNAVSYNVKNATLTISPGGFLSQTQQTCTGYNDNTKQKTGCTTKIVTPGSAIEDSLHATFQGQLDSLQLGDSIDQILGALTNAITTKVLYNGLANAGNVGQAAGNPATTQAQSLMNDIQAGVTAAQQYASIEQGTISDIQNSQKNLANLADCWSKLASSTSVSSSKNAEGNAGFTSTVSAITALQNQVTQYNSKIAGANTSITQLQSLQTSLLLATVASDVSNVQNQFNSLKATGSPHFFTSTDVTTAQQDRASVQASIASTNQNTSTQLAQCYADGQ